MHPRVFGSIEKMKRFALSVRAVLTNYMLRENLTVAGDDGKACQAIHGEGAGIASAGVQGTSEYCEKYDVHAI